METGVVHVGDCLELLRRMPADSVDLVFTSPPYEDARTYGVEFRLRGEEYVAWALERYLECLRVSRGLVAWVIDSPTRAYRWGAAPMLLAADLHRAGVHLRRAPIYKRHGIPGSGGRDWFRCDHELVICAARPGRLPWSDNTACGRACRFAPGGAPTHRGRSGERVNTMNRRRRPTGTKETKRYRPPAVANPGTIIDCGAVGGGNIGSKLAHENEAPFPEALAERFVRSFCPPGGIVLDPFMGSGTTAAVAERFGRRWIGMDIRDNQRDLTSRRVQEVTA